MRNLQKDPFLRIDSPRHGDILADGVVELLRDRGVDAVTMRALAQWMKVTPSALSHRAKWPETVLLLVEALGNRYGIWSTGALAWGGTPALPRTIVERHGVRAWVLARELALSEEAQGRGDAMERWQLFAAHEDALVREWWRNGHPESRYDAYRALLDGTRLALAFNSSLRLADAEALLRLLNMC